MIKDIFYSDPIRHKVDSAQYIDYYIQVKDGKIIAGTPDMSFTSLPLKLDLLLYSSINRYGEVLTSLVYISGPKSSDDTSEIIFNPYDTLHNSAFEKTMLIEDVGGENLWLNADIEKVNIDLLKHNSIISTHPYERFAINTDFASKVYNDNLRLDGWYSLLSITPEENPTDDPIGMLWTYISQSLETIQYYVGGGLSINLEDRIQNSARLLDSIIHSDAAGPYVRVPFFVIKDTNTLYQDSLSKKLDREWYSRINAIKPKVTALYAAGAKEEYDVMQYIIQSMDLTLITF